MADRIQVVYRDVDRTPLLYVIREMAAEHERLEVVVERVAGAKEYEEGFLRGEFDLSCEHLRFLFPARLEGHPVRCLAACQNRSASKLVAAAGVRGVADLPGKTIAVRATPATRISTIYWLKRLGLEGRVETMFVEDDHMGRWQQWRKVVSGEAHAAVVSPLYLDPAIDAGLHVLDAPPLPEIGPLFFAALGPFIARHDDALRRFMPALYRAVHTFRRDPEATLAVISGEPARLMGLKGEPALRRQYEHLRADLDERPVPRLDALATTFAMLSEGYPELPDMNPLTLWDLRYVIELEEQRFMEGLGDRAGG